MSEGFSAIQFHALSPGSGSVQFSLSVLQHVLTAGFLIIVSSC